jgi:hypothetical protein
LPASAPKSLPNIVRGWLSSSWIGRKPPSYDVSPALRGQEFDHFYAADLTGASAVQVGDRHLDVTIWRPGEPERIVRKH